MARTTTTTTTTSERRALTVGLTADGAEYGGAEVSLTNVVRAFEAGFGEVVKPDLRFVLIGHRCAAMDGLIERLPHLEAAIVDRAESATTRVRNLRWLLTTVKPDVLQVTLSNPLAAREAQLAGVLARTATVVVEQLVRPMGRPQALAKSALSRLLVDHVAVGSHSASDIERFAHMPSGSVRVIHNGVPVPSQDEVRLRPLPPLTPSLPRHADDRFVVGTVGRLEHQKGIDRLIPLLPELPNVHLMVVGSGSQEAALRAMAERLNVLDRVSFVGWVEDPGSLMAEFDAFVLASRNEAFPLTVVEAMLRGVPVVATDVGSIADAVIDGQTGWLVPPDQPHLIVDHIRSLASNPALRNRIGNQARQHALNHFTADSMARLYLDMWRRPRGRLGFTSMSIGQPLPMPSPSIVPMDVAI